ncbi:MAG: DNA-3-methyladenine glycosylase [Myxococcota bacterium]
MRLPQRFYRRDVVEVARDLIGKEIRRGPVRVRITEVEAYREDDSACHAFRGRTRRTEVLFGPPGRAYVYLCYGLHQMLNIVTNPTGIAAAVLIRACEPVAGLPLIRRRRGGKEGPVLLTGPGKVGAALALDTSWSGHRLYAAGEVEVHQGAAPDRIRVGPRVGIDYAAEADRNLPWRFAAADSRWVSHPTTLSPPTARQRKATEETS